MCHLEGSPGVSRCSRKVVRAEYFTQGLEDAIGVSAVHPTWQKTKPDDPSDEHYGWTFASPDDPPFQSPNGAGSLRLA